MRKFRNLVKKVFAPAVLKNKRTMSRGEPRQKVAPDRPPCVLRLAAHGDPWEKAWPVWQDLWNEWFAGQRVLVKVNLNTADPYPASTCPVFLKEFLKFLHRSGVNDILVGDCASLSSLPTRKTARAIGLDRVVTGLAEPIFFDEMEWVEVSVPGQFLKAVTVPAVVYEVDRIISLTNLKTHRWADFSMAMKAAVGNVHPLERRNLHQDHLQQKIVELNLAVMADLNIIDGRVAMITGGPAVGTTAPAGVILAGDHPAAVDLQAYRELLQIKQRHHCVENFRSDPLEMPQLQHAAMVWPAAEWQCYRLYEY